MEAALHKLVNRSAAPRPAPAAVPMRPVPTGTVQLQSTLRVSSPRDPAEREAEATARKVMRMATPEVAAASVERPGDSGSPPPRGKLESPYIARFSDSIRLMRQHAAGPTIARRGEGQPAVGANVASEIAQSQGAGAPLPSGVRNFMEPRFGADFSRVRIHTGETAARLNRQVSAQAFTVGNQIFFGRNQFRPDTPAGQELIAHELTHTIQQGAAVQGAPRVQRSEDVTVTEQSPPQVQRLGLSDALRYFADAANAIPGFRMFTIVLGVNPINMSRVERSPANILRAVVEFLPGGNLITRALDNYGVFDRVGGWISQQLESLGLSGSTLREAINRFLDSLSWRDIFNLGGVWDRARRIFTEPIDRLMRFVRGLASAVLGFIKDAILRPIAELASRTRGWNLLCAVLGVNPITGGAVPRSAENLIGGFMKLIGQEEIWENIKRGNAIARAWAWFQGALSGVMSFVRAIPQRFVQAVMSLEISDLVLLPRAFARVAGVFGDFIGNFLGWAGNTAWSLLEIIFSVVAPSLMVYLRRAAGAFRTILQNPVAFVGYLVRAAMLGFRQFASRFLTHLRGSLIGWLTGALSGANIYIPQGLTLREIIKFVLSVLGLTWQNLRQKIVRVIGEPAMRVLETGFDLVMTLVTQGPSAAWERLQESLSNLREMVLEQIMSFVQERVVTAAMTRLLSMLSPAGAFIQAIIATYNTVMFFVERLRQISQVAVSFIDSIAAIAAGNIAFAANRVEQTMGGMLTLVISFLARIAGLGRVTDAVTSVVTRVRQPIDRALDRVVEWIVAQARRLGRLVVQAGVPQDPNERLRLAAQAAVSAARRLTGRVTRALLDPFLTAIRVRYALAVLQPYEQGGTWWVRASVNPTLVQNLFVPSDSAAGGRRAPEGPNYQPLVGKLTQAVRMFTEWARRGTSPVAQQMLRQLETAREQAQSLYEDQDRGSPEHTLEPRKQALASQLRAIQTLDPRYELVSVGELSITVLNARRQMPRTPLPPWTMLDPALRPEYVRQLRDQEDGLNSMVAAQALANRVSFLTTGRTREEASMRREFGRRMGRPAGTAAPHNPDQSLLGFRDPTGPAAVGAVNSHIGSQNPGKIPAIMAALNAISPAAQLVTQLNFELSVV